MVNPQLLDYIKQQLQQNVSKEQIKNSLLANGWQTSDIDEAFSSLQPNIPSPHNVIPQPSTTFFPKPMHLWISVGAIFVTCISYYFYFSHIYNSGLYPLSAVILVLSLQL